MLSTANAELQVGQRSMALALEVYKSTQVFPKHELYGLTARCEDVPYRFQAT